MVFIGKSKKTDVTSIQLKSRYELLSKHKNILDIPTQKNTIGVSK